jgi:hypothetical protein
MCYRPAYQKRHTTIVHEIPVEELDPIPEPEALNPDG